MTATTAKKRLDNRHPIRVANATHDRLVIAATERGVSVQWLVNRLLDEALDNLVPADELTLVRR